MRAYIFIKVQPQKTRDVARQLAGIAGVKAAHPCWGMPDVIAQVEVEDQSVLENLVLGQIQAIEGVIETDTHIALGD